MSDAAVSVAIVRGRLRSERVGTLVIVALVAVTAFIFAAAPLLFERAADAALRDAVRTASPAERRFEFTQEGRIIAGSAVAIGPLEAAGRALQEELPPLVRSVVGQPAVRFDTIEYAVLEALPSTARLKMRYQAGIDDEIRYVDGVPPTARVGVAEVGSQLAPDGSPLVAPVYEVSLSSTTADQLDLAVGDRLMMVPERGQVDAGLQIHVSVEVVGIFEAVDRSAAAWESDTSLLSARIERIGFDQRIIHATALVAPETYSPLFGAGHPEGGPPTPGLPPQLDLATFSYGWRFPVDPNGIDPGRLDELEGELTRLAAQYPFSGVSRQPMVQTEPMLQTGLLAVIERYREQRRASEAALAVAILGPAGAAAGAVALVCSMYAHRRRSVTMLVRGRGASTRQVLGAQLVEAMVLVAPAVALSAVAAILVFDGRSDGPAVSAAVAVAVIAVALLIGAALPGARSPIGELPLEPAVVRQQWARRLVLDGLVVTIAAIGAVVLRGRGLRAEASSGVDPYLAAVPVLVGLAAGLVALRLYPLPIRLLAMAASTLRDLVPSLALRNAARETTSGHLPLVVLLLATAMGVFSSVILSTIEHEQQVTSWRRVGADFRIEAGTSDPVLPPLDPGAIPGVEAWTAAYLVDGRIDGGSVQREPVLFAAVEPGPHERVLADTPGERHLPPPFHATLGAAALPGSIDQPLPAIISETLASRASLRRGEAFMAATPIGDASFRVVGVRAGFPGLPPDRPFVLAPYPALRQAFPTETIRATTLFVRAPAAAGPAIASAIERDGTGIRIESRHDMISTLRDAPLTVAVTAGFAASLGVALCFSALALAAGSALALAARKRQLAVLRTLGLQRRQLVSLIVVEHAPMTVLAILGGVVLGLGIAWLAGPALGLGAIIGPDNAIRSHIDWAQVLLLGVAPVALLAVVVAGGAWLVQRADLARQVRWSEP